MNLKISDAFERSTEAQQKFVGLHFKYRVTDPSAPLVVLIHGRAGTMDVKLLFRRCFPESCTLVSFQAPYKDVLGGFSWWDVDSPYIEKNAVAAASELWESLFRCIEQLDLDPEEIWLSGFSQGAGLSSVLLQQHSSYLSKVALLAGFTVKLQETAGFPIDKAFPEKEESLSKVLIVHGVEDDVVPVEVAEQGAKYLSSIGHSVQFFSEEGVGHKIGREGMRRLKGFFGG